MDLGRPCKSRKESKRTRLAEMVMNPADELQPTWLKTILVQMLDKETKLHVGEEIGKDGVTFEQAVHLVRQEINANYEVILRDLAPQEVFVQYQAEVSQLWFPWN